MHSISVHLHYKSERHHCEDVIVVESREGVQIAEKVRFAS